MSDEPDVDALARRTEVAIQKGRAVLDNVKDFPKASRHADRLRKLLRRHT